VTFSKSINRLLAATFLLVLFAQGDDGSGTEAFCERAKSEFNSLLRRCKSERVEYWKQRSNEALKRTIAKQKQLQATSEYLNQQPNAKELQAVFAYDYLNEIHEVQLVEATRLVEDLGRELVNDRYASELLPITKDLEVQFGTLRGKPQSERVQSSYASFLELQRRIAQIEADAPVKEAFTFQPMANAYASEPIKTVVYTIHDWNAALAKIDEIKQQLQPIRDSLQTARFFSPKDPIPWLPVLTQVAFLRVAIAGWIKSYHTETVFRTIGILVLSSMSLSVFLVFHSDETLFNILRQSLIPGGFIFCTGSRRKKLASTDGSD
jgi:hypothetical protein